MAHRRACADVWGDRIAAMIAQDTPTLRAVDPRTWITKTEYHAQDFQPSLQAITAQRADLLAVPEPLAPDGRSRTATVTGAGKVLERTVLFNARWMARHERPYLKQTQRIVNAMRM